MSDSETAEQEVIHLPVLGQAGDSASDWTPRTDRLNPNCVFVQRAGAPIYESCIYCEKELKDCLKDRRLDVARPNSSQDVRVHLPTEVLKEAASTFLLVCGACNPSRLVF